jgi:hypothetical protein
MINALWLLLIIPISASVGLLAAALCMAAGKTDTRVILEGLQKPTWKIKEEK